MQVQDPDENIWYIFMVDYLDSDKSELDSDTAVSEKMSGGEH